MIRLGDGTDESHAKMQAAIDDLWMYTGEMFAPDAIELALIDAGIAADVRALAAPWRQHVDAVLAAATLTAPDAALHAAGRQAGRAHRAPRPSARRDAGPAARVSGSALVIDAPCSRRRRARGDGAAVAAASRRGRRSARSGTSLAAVPDPEIPVVSVVELGIVRGVEWDAADPATLVVTVTPTYSGCPATELIMTSIRDALAAAGVARRADRDAARRRRGRPTG